MAIPSTELERLERRWWGAAGVFSTGTGAGETNNLRIEHTLSNGTVRADASTAVSLTVGHSNLFRFEVQGNEVRAKAWDSFSSEPFTGGTDNDGFILKATMATDIVTAGGRFQLIMLGPSTAGAANGYGRIRNLQFYDFAVSPPGTPVTPTFKMTPRQARGRRR
jgi:hypothetical protein